MPQSYGKNVKRFLQQHTQKPIHTPIKNKFKQKEQMQSKEENQEQSISKTKQTEELQSGD